MSRKQEPEHEPEEDLERWVVTYADMITLLLAFFIMMYAMSVLNQGKFQKVVRSVKVELGIGSAGSPIVSAGDGSTTGSAGILAGDIAGVLKDRLGDSFLRSDIEVLSAGDTVTIRLHTRDLFFKAGSAQLQPYLRKVLLEVAEVLKPLPYQIRVEGHTCNLPIRTKRYPSNWELSAQRAINVLTYLVRYGGLPAARLSATGYADTRPIASNASEAGRRKNRRVDIVLLHVTSAPRLQVRPQPHRGERPPPAGAAPVRLMSPVTLSR